MKSQALILAFLFTLSLTSCRSMVSEDSRPSVAVPASEQEEQDLIRMASEDFWKAFKTGDGQLIANHLDSHLVTLELEHSIPPSEEKAIERFEFQWANDVLNWIDSLHSPDETGAIWANALRVEDDSDGRVMADCDETSCRFEGNIQHNTLFLDEVSFLEDQTGVWLRSIRVVHGD